MRYCERCGAQIPDGALVCPACGQGTQPQPQAAPSWGAQAPAAPRPTKASGGKGGGKLLFLLLGIVIAGAVTAALLATGVLQFGSGGESAAGKAAKVEGPGYDKPADAVWAYAEALKAGDMDAMLSTFAVESYAKHFDREAFLLNGGVALLSFSPPNGLMPPADQGLALALNLEGRRTQIAQSIYYQYISCLLHNTAYEDSFGRVLQLPEPEDVRALMELLQQDPGFSGMTIGIARSPNEILDTERLESYLENYQTNIDRLIKWYGAQDIQDVCLELNIDGEPHCLFILTACYDGKWYNLSFSSPLGAYLGVNTMSGGPVPMDEIEY